MSSCDIVFRGCCCCCRLAAARATSALWNKTELDAWNQPANPAGLRLFMLASKRILRSLMTEYLERHDTNRTTVSIKTKT